MKFFLIIPTLKQGGAERVVSILANEFHAKGIHVEVILLAEGEDFYTLNADIKINRLGFKTNQKLIKIINEIKLFKNFRKLVEKKNPDIILSFGDKYNVFTLIATIGLGVRVFVSDRSNPKKVIPKLTDLLRKITYKYATGIIAQTKLAKDILEQKTLNKNIQVIPNPVKEIQNYPDNKKEKIILNVGRLVPEKGQVYLIEAFSKIKEKADWKMVILGDGILRNELELQARQLGVGEQVKFLGAVENVDRWLARASIFAFSSISEGFPNALAEAMAAGLPVVSFDCDAGPSDLIKTDENGILVPTKNVKCLTESMNLLMRDKALRNKLGEKAKDVNLYLDKKNIALSYIEFMINN